jgi:hypothetical protein
MEIHDDMLTPASHDVSLCRVCLSMDHDNQCIFRKDWNNPNDTFMLSEKLQLCSGVEVRLLLAFFLSFLHHTNICAYVGTLSGFGE